MLSRVRFEFRFFVVIGSVVVSASDVSGSGLLIGNGFNMLVVGETDCFADSSMISGNGWITQNVFYGDNTNV